MPVSKKKKSAKKGKPTVAKALANLNAVLDNIAQPQYGAGKSPGHLFGIVKGALPKDSAPYSYHNIHRAFAAKDWQYAKGERLIHEDLLKAGYSPPENGGILVPLDPGDIEAQCPQMKGLKAKMAPDMDGYLPSNLKTVHDRQKALSAFGDDTAGGALVMPVMASSIIELMRPQVVMERAGCQVIALPPSGQLIMSRQTSDPTFYWVGENTAITDSQPGLGNLVFSAKRAAGLVILSNDSLRYTNPSIEVVTRNALASRGAVFEDKAFLEGPGSSFSPKGLINYSGITTHISVGLGTDGNTFSFEDPTQMIAKVFAANDPMGPTAWIVRPELWAGLTNRRADAVTANDGKGAALNWLTMGDISKGIPDRLRNVPIFPTTQVSNTRAKGSGTALTYALLGNFRHAAIARSGVMEMAMDQSGSYFAADQSAVRCIMRVDFGLFQERPFILCDTLINA